MSSYEDLNLILDEADRNAGRPTYAEEKEASRKRFIRVLEGNATPEEERMLSEQEREAIGAIRGYRDGTLQKKLERVEAFLALYQAINPGLSAQDTRLRELQGAVREANGNLHRGKTFSERVDQIGNWSDL